MKKRRWWSTPVAGQTMEEAMAALTQSIVTKYVWTPGVVDAQGVVEAAATVVPAPLDDIERARQKREGLKDLSAEWASAVAACRAVAREHGATFIVGPPMSIAEPGDKGRSR